MDKKSDTEGVPGPSIDASMTARHWWREDGSMLLPGEKGGSTVFEISFWDGCRYVGHTETTVFECADDLVASPWDERRSRFVAEHCARMGYVGHMETTVFECADDLVASPWDERRSRFVAEHCARMGYVVRCIASDLEVQGLLIVATSPQSPFVVRLSNNEGRPFDKLRANGTLDF